MHSYVTLGRERSEFEHWLADDAVVTLERLHAAMRGRAATDWPTVLDRVLGFVGMLKDLGRFDAATRIVQMALSDADFDARLRVRLQLQLAECHRRAYRWERCRAVLAEIAGDEAALLPSDLLELVVQRAALWLQRGLPDLAVSEVERAEALAADPWSRAQAMFVRLRLEHALQRPARAMTLLQDFLNRPECVALVDDEDWQMRVTQLRIRAALAVLIEPGEPTANDVEALAWLRAAIDDPTTPADERILARSVFITNRLDRGMLDGLDRELTAAHRDLPDDAVTRIDERRLTLATLTLRFERLRGGEGEAARQSARDLERRWRLLVDRWQEQPASRIGAGPLFFGDSRRSFVELLRWRLREGTAGEPAASALAEVAAATATGSLAKGLGAGVPSLKRVRAALCGPASGVLVFVPGHECSVAFVVDARSVGAHILPTGSLAIDVARRQLLRAIAAVRQGETSNRLAVAASRCGELLLPAAVQARIRSWEAVSIVGLESLGYLPFELLPLSTGKRVGVVHAVSYLPSLAVGVWLAEERAPIGPTPRLRVAACPDAVPTGDTAEKPVPLPLLDSDFSEWRDSYRGLAVDELTGLEVTRAATFESAEDEGIDVLHVLAHGIRDEGRSDPQGILLGDGTVLWADDLEAQRCPPYVFFSVCRAGRGRIRRGDDGRHLLSGSALLSGARGVVLPVFDVGYRPTLRFFADVHHGLWREGLSLAESLRRARARAESRGGVDAIDAFLFHLIGRGERPLLESQRARELPWQGWVTGTLIVVLTLAGVGWLRIRRSRRRVARYSGGRPS